MHLLYDDPNKWFTRNNNEPINRTIIHPLIEVGPPPQTHREPFER